MRTTTERTAGGRKSLIVDSVHAAPSVRGSPLPLVSQQSAGASGRRVGVAVRDTHHFLIASSFSVLDSVDGYSGQRTGDSKELNPHFSG